MRQTRWRIMFLVALGLWAVPTLAQRPAPAGAVKARVKTLADAYKAAQQAYFKKLNAAKTNVDKAQVELTKPKVETYAAQLLDLARSQTKDPGAIDALEWVVMNCQPGAEVDKALKMLAEDHADKAALAPLLERLKPAKSDAIEDFFQTVAEKSALPAVQATALFSLAAHHRDAAQRGLKKGEKIDRSSPHAEKAIGLYERIGEEFADVAAPKNKKFGELARAELKNFKPAAPVGTIAAGSPAPEIEGTDIEGKALTLSSFRGKVVLLDFWGHW